MQFFFCIVDITVCVSRQSQGKPTLPITTDRASRHSWLPGIGNHTYCLLS